MSTSCAASRPKRRSDVATAAQWVEGARPRTLPAAIAPVLAGTGAAALEDSVRPLRAVLALVVALALQVAVNYANDYSDGLRGTDAVRVGPMRLPRACGGPGRPELAAGRARVAVAGERGRAPGAPSCCGAGALGAVCLAAA